MTEAERIEAAVAFARKAHEGQRYGDGPYIEHPLRVMAAVSDRAKVVAVLHDVWEGDEERFLSLTLPEFVSAQEFRAVYLLTRHRGERYTSYIGWMVRDQTVAGEIAREVKIADLRDNLAHSPPDSLRRRYEKALKLLAPEPGNER